MSDFNDGFAKFDHPMQTPPAPARTLPCGWCNGTGEDADVSIATCDCECHLGFHHVLTLATEKRLAWTFALDMIDGIRSGVGYCRVCKDGHPCYACDGRGEVAE